MFFCFTARGVKRQGVMPDTVGIRFGYNGRRRSHLPVYDCDDTCRSVTGQDSGAQLCQAWQGAKDKNPNLSCGDMMNVLDPDPTLVLKNPKYCGILTHLFWTPLIYCFSYEGFGKTLTKKAGHRLICSCESDVVICPIGTCGWNWFDKIA